MIYLVNTGVFQREKILLELFETINGMKPCLILYHKSHKYLNKNLNIKSKFGFSKSKNFNKEKIEQEIVLNYNVSVFTISEINDLIDYIENKNKIMFLFSSKDALFERYLGVNEYLNKKNINYKEFHLDSFEESLESFYKRLRRSFMVDYVTS